MRIQTLPFVQLLRWLGICSITQEVSRFLFFLMRRLEVLQLYLCFDGSCGENWCSSSCEEKKSVGKICRSSCPITEGLVVQTLGLCVCISSFVESPPAHVFNTSMCSLSWCVQVCDKLRTSTDLSISKLCDIISGSGRWGKRNTPLISRFLFRFLPCDL